MDTSEQDDVYGDPAMLEASVASGAEQLEYLMKGARSQEWLANFNGGMGDAPRDPELLADLEPESEPDAWEDV